MSLQPQKNARHPVAGAGLGFRRALLPELRASDAAGIDFFELAPENWIHAGGKLARDLRHFSERFPFVAHGLSLSLGGPAPLDENLLRDIRGFLDDHGIRAYTEHLSYCSDEGHLYDLMPIPFTDEAVRWVAGRIRRAQEILERPIAVENVSYYAAPGARMSEIEFLRAVLDEADCGLLLDVNNIYVNAINHRYDARALPARAAGGARLLFPRRRPLRRGARPARGHPRRRRLRRCLDAARRGLRAVRSGADAARARFQLPAARDARRRGRRHPRPPAPAGAEVRGGRRLNRAAGRTTEGLRRAPARPGARAAARGHRAAAHGHLPRALLQ